MRTDYEVHYGWCHENVQKFATFDDAMQCVAGLADAQKRYDVRVYNMNRYDVDYQGDPLEPVVYDGLTDDEREAVWEYR